MKITVLGCGSSMGVPAAGDFWGKCDPSEPRNNRTRASLLVQSEKTDILIDTTYDLRIHLNRLKLKKIDGVLLSHSHSDHVNGIDDLRAISYHNEKFIDIYGHQETLDEVQRRWPYLFEEDARGIYKRSFDMHPIDGYGRYVIGDIEYQSFEQDHTSMMSLGFRFGDFAYSVDMADLPERSIETLKGVETWIVDAASYHRENVVTHANLKRVLNWVDILKPKMTYLTVLTGVMDYQTLCDELPPHIRPAYDGLEIDMGGNIR